MKYRVPVKTIRFSFPYPNTSVDIFHNDTSQVEVKKPVSLHFVGIETLRLEALYTVM